MLFGVTNEQHTHGAFTIRDAIGYADRQFPFALFSARRFSSNNDESEVIVIGLDHPSSKERSANVLKKL